MTSAIRTGSQVGPVASTAKVGDTLYWTIDIPGKMIKETNANLKRVVFDIINENALVFASYTL